MDATFRTMPLAVLLVLVATPSLAGEIHRCRGAEGALAFQDRPCAPNAQSLGAQAVEESAASPAAQKTAREEAARIAAWERASRARLAPSLGGRARAAGPHRGAPQSARSTRTAPDACAAARAQREAAYRSDGNRMGFDRRRALQDAVTAACGLR